MKLAIYDSQESQNISLDALKQVYRNLGVTRIVYKILTNDNTKNQIYLAPHLTDLGFLPMGPVSISETSSKKPVRMDSRAKFTAAMDFSWISPKGEIYPAPEAKIIYYPQYPEARLSGFLKGCGADLSDWMDRKKKATVPGRVLILGMTEGKKSIHAYLAIPGSRVVEELGKSKRIELTSILLELPVSEEGTEGGASRELLIRELKRIHNSGWIRGKRLKNGKVISYTAQNSGGYTLEAELGIGPNGVAGPDFMDWEIKQFGVKKFSQTFKKPLTLMTPQPDGGVYAEIGTRKFVIRYGYEDTGSGKKGRYVFNGRHFYGVKCEKTGLTLMISGYDPAAKTMVDPAGFIGLQDEKGNIVAKWSFSKMIGHWVRKHARAAYVPAIREGRGDETRFHFGNDVWLYEGANILRFLRAIADGLIYYDPGSRVDPFVNPEVKARSQFRISSSYLERLYRDSDQINVLDH